jgi:hypothetical protein
MADQARRGARQAAAFISPQNTVSQSLHRRLGFTPYARITYRRWLLLRIYHVRPTEATPEGGRACRVIRIGKSLHPKINAALWPPSAAIPEKAAAVSQSR